MANSTALAKADVMAQAALAKALRQANNENAAKFFAAGMAGVIFLFMTFHWGRLPLALYYQRRARRIGSLELLVRISRSARSLLLLKVPGFVSGCHALVFVGYLATCIIVSLVNIDWSSLNNWAKRLGWVAASNIAFTTFLSLKNTPLGFLTGYSYERLNILHQLAGYCTIMWSLMHAVVYIIAWSKSNSLDQLLERTQVAGIVAGFAMVTILGTVLLLRKLRYEVFYVVHIVMFMLILITVGMHRPELATKTLIIVIFAASIWGLDRILRFMKISLFSFGNTVTINPLPHGGTRIVLRRSPRCTVPGSHCFLWVPGIRMAETHPFTVVSTAPLEFVIAACDGFTRDLHAFALKYPGRSLRASIDGPYGVIPDFNRANKILLIAGGSGASFSLGVAADIVRKLGDSTTTVIEVVWVVKEPEIIEWYLKELETLVTSPLVTLHVHATRSSPPSPSTPIPHVSVSALPDIEKSSPPSVETSLPETSVSQRHSSDYDIEKYSEPTSPRSRHSTVICSGRPDVASIIMESVEKADPHDRIVVAACGPESLMETARRTVARCIKADGPHLDLHCQQFGF